MPRKMQEMVYIYIYLHIHTNVHMHRHLPHAHVILGSVLGGFFSRDPAGLEVAGPSQSGRAVSCPLMVGRSWRSY